MHLWHIHNILYTIIFSLMVFGRAPLSSTATGPSPVEMMCSEHSVSEGGDGAYDYTVLTTQYALSTIDEYLSLNSF